MKNNSKWDIFFQGAVLGLIISGIIVGLVLLFKKRDKKKGDITILNK